MKRVPLNNHNWTLRAVGDLAAVPAALRAMEVPARVPGCAHTDLVRAGLIPDPLVGMNEREVQWIGETDWEYRRRFDADPELLAHERVDLVCDGLDTIAEVRVNGTEVGRAANMFHPHRFDLRAAVRPGENELSITFRSPLKHIRAEEARLGKRPVNGDWDPYVFIRKAACSFGWDWAPKLAGCGIWKTIGLESWSAARIAGVVPVARRISDTDWEVDVTVTLDRAQTASTPHTVAVLLRNAHLGPFALKRPINQFLFAHPPPGERECKVTFAVSNPHLWSPRTAGSAGVDGDGKQSLCMLHVTLHAPKQPALPIHEWSKYIGFRDVKLKTPKDEHGTAFTFEVNGREVFCKGANWVPEGPWPGQVPREQYRQRLQQAAAANMNMLRVWGGGSYEDDAFYEICDELGIMVWQDFMFACAMYPEEAPFPALIEAEARHQVARLSPHPSIVLWCGGNECTWAHDAWGNAAGERPWKDRLAGKSWGSTYYHQLLPRLVRELSPGVPYWPNSPWQGSEGLPPNSPDHGDRHTWDKRADGYRDLVPRFCSEFGQQSPSNFETLVRAVGEPGLKPGSETLNHRQRATGGTTRHIDEVLEQTFRKPRDLDEWHFLAQLTQARAMKSGIEWLRINQPRCMGALIWQFNDCWADMSWSLVDSDGREKPAHHAAKHAFRNRLLTIQPTDGRPWLHAVNDLEQPAEYTVVARRMSFEGEVLASVDSVAAACPPRSSSGILDLTKALGDPQDPRREFIVAETPGHRATWFYSPDRELNYPEPRWSLAAGEGNAWVRTVSIRADTFLRDLTLMSDRTPGAVLRGPMLTTLLPGESCHIEVRLGMPDEDAPDQAPPDLDPQSLIRRPALWCANWFGAP